jgi:hypothetical protein
MAARQDLLISFALAAAHFGKQAAELYCSKDSNIEV